MESEELYSSLLSSTLQFVRSKIIFQIHLLTNTFSQHHLACSFLGHLVWKIGDIHLLVACNHLEINNGMLCYVMEILLRSQHLLRENQLVIVFLELMFQSIVFKETLRGYCIRY